MVYLIALVILGWSLSFFIPRSVIRHLPGIRDHHKKKKIMFWSQNALLILTLSFVLLIAEPFLIDLLKNDFYRVFIQGTQKILYSLSALSVIFLLYHTVDPIFDSIQSKWFLKDSLNSHVLPLLKKVMSFIVVVTGGLLLVQNLGYNITSLLAGLGIGGVAIALAAKDTLSNFLDL